MQRSNFDTIFYIYDLFYKYNGSILKQYGMLSYISFDNDLKIYE